MKATRPKSKLMKKAPALKSANLYITFDGKIIREDTLKKNLLFYSPQLSCYAFYKAEAL